MSDPKWWKEAIGFQIWPASYKDSNNDGYGDIPGIISTLDYVESLGIDFIWLSPTYDSPQHDWGYDISNYEDVWPKYGTLEDMDNLIEGCHSRGIKLLLDLVVNHTSDEHAWFQESKQSRTNKRADWYIWRDPKVTDVTREAIYESAIRFWLHKGIDGFRVDIVNAYSKNQSFPDSTILFPDDEFQPIDSKFYVNGPRMHEWLREQRHQALDPFGEGIVLIGELPMTSTEEIMRYTSSRNRELDMIFDFDFLLSGVDANQEPHLWGPPKLPEVKAAFAKAQGFLADKHLDAWTTVFMENHDCTRSVSKFGDDSTPESWARSAKMLCMLLCTLSGTLFVYQGQEIGMTSLPEDFAFEDMRDGPWIRRLQETIAKHPGDEDVRRGVMRAFRNMGRDNNRTPVQWDDTGPTAGFTSASVPWMKVNDSYKSVNVRSQLGVRGSVLEFWKQLIKLRKSVDWKDMFVYGDFELLDAANENTFTFVKSSGKQKALIMLNFSGEEQPCYWPERLDTSSSHLLRSNYDESAGKATNLRAWEGRIYTSAQV